MICLEINKRPFYYCLYNGLSSVMDGVYDTGEKTVNYSAPVLCRANIAPATGNALVDLFGTDEKYDRIIVMDNDTAPLIDEQTVLCVDVAPVYSQGKVNYDYVVRRIAKSLNFTALAIRKVRS